MAILLDVILKNQHGKMMQDVCQNGKWDFVKLLLKET